MSFQLVQIQFSFKHIVGDHVESNALNKKNRYADREDSPGKRMGEIDAAGIGITENRQKNQQKKLNRIVKYHIGYKRAYDFVLGK